MRHWQYNVIVTQATGVIKYSVSDSVDEKGTNVNRKKLPVHVWSVCEEFAIKHKESRSSTNKQSLWKYQYCIFWWKPYQDWSSCSLWNVYIWPSREYLGLSCCDLLDGHPKWVLSSSTIVLVYACWLWWCNYKPRNRK